ncbi:hypothetical protein Tco_1346179 [Tanacetum coccineum]
MVSKHHVYSRKRIIAITHVKVMKWYDYGYLEEIEVRRENETLHKFKEGDFPNLNLHDIEDMLLLLVEKKILNLLRDVIFDLNVALRMFTRRVVIQKRVEDLQLGVESYQKKLNITRPDTFRSDISNKTSYISYNSPRGIIYLDKFNRNRLMRSDELYKCCDGTLTFVRTALHDIAFGLRMEYLPKRRWSERDKSRSRIMIKAIDKQLYERRLMRNLEKFVGGREYGEDFSNILRVLRIILVILPEHQSDTYVLTMKMEILPGSTSNSTVVDPHGFEDICKDGRGGTGFQQTQRFIATCSYSTDKCKDIMKAQKNRPPNDLPAEHSRGHTRSTHNEGTLNPEIVDGLIHILDEHSGLVQLFRTAQDKYNDGEIPGFKIRLYNMGGVRGYKLLTSDILGGIVVLPRINVEASRWQRQRQKVNNERILQISVAPTSQRVCAYLERGDCEGITVGSKIMLPSTFTKGPRMFTPVFVDPEISTQAYLVETDTESEPFEDLVETETPESPHTVASPTSLPDSTPPTRHAEESEDSDTSGARSTSSDFTAPLSPDHPLTYTSPPCIAEVAAMSDLAFRKRFRSSYESSPSSSPPDLTLRKHSWGTSELVKDDVEEEEEEEDEEVEERVNTPGSDENRLKLYELMYKIVKVADTRVKD